jgi:hypothetical protein
MWPVNLSKAELACDPPHQLPAFAHMSQNLIERRFNAVVTATMHMCHRTFATCHNCHMTCHKLYNWSCSRYISTICAALHKVHSLRNIKMGKQHEYAGVFTGMYAACQDVPTLIVLLLHCCCHSNTSTHHHSVSSNCTAGGATVRQPTHHNVGSSTASKLAPACQQQQIKKGKPAAS